MKTKTYCLHLTDEKDGKSSRNQGRGRAIAGIGPGREGCGQIVMSAAVGKKRGDSGKGEAISMRGEKRKRQLNAAT